MAKKENHQPVVIDVASIRVEVFGERQADGRLSAFSRSFEDWPRRIHVINREFMLEETDRKFPAEKEAAWYILAPKQTT